MAFFTDNISSQPHASFVAKIWGRIAQFFDNMIEAQDRSLDVQRLQRLSDRELADIGIKREDIVRHVYRNIYYF
jgi:uncharacterized protein YjiS (DUF1127 family)